MCRYGKKPKSLRRTVGNRRELRTIVVFTEGKKSEPDYINALKKLPHVQRDVTLNLELRPEHGVPLTLVRLAVERKSDPEVDECWCVFDVEWPKNHPNLPAAVSLAKANDISLAISNPCFEVWLILHHKEFNQFHNTAVVESKSRDLDQRLGKAIDAAPYLPLRKKAILRARRLDEAHERNGTVFPHNNPSSGMYRFLRSLEGDDRPC